eukprot:1209242-Alexandrium_andersonii.AAC.1
MGRDGARAALATADVCDVDPGCLISVHVLELIQVLHMQNSEMGHVLCAHGSIQHEAAHAFHDGMRLWLVGKDAF